MLRETRDALLRLEAAVNGRSGIMDRMDSLESSMRDLQKIKWKGVGVILVVGSLATVFGRHILEFLFPHK